MDFEAATEEKEYAKDHRITRDDIKALKKWVKDDPYLPEVSEFMLIQCYQVSDYNYKQCLKLVETLYDYKNQAPELFTGLDYDSSKYQKKFFDVHYLFLLPDITFQGNKIIYCGLKDIDAQNFDTEYYISMSIKTLFAMIFEQGTCPGYIVISDAFGYSFGHIRRLNFGLMKKLLRFVAEAIPIKMKEIHLIQAHRISYYILALLRPFLSKEINESIHIYSDMNKFFDVVPKEYVPKDLGGTLPFTKDEYNEIQRRKMIYFSKEVDSELERRSSNTTKDDGL